MGKNLNFRVNEDSLAFACGAFYFAGKAGIDESVVIEILKKSGYNAISLALAQSTFATYLDSIEMDNVELVKRAKYNRKVSDDRDDDEDGDSESLPALSLGEDVALAKDKIDKKLKAKAGAAPDHIDNGAIVE